ncbi:MAG: sulfatase [Bacteroidetes bacterium]|nr:MAG: sulfatase [Bacteroidota bacterium]
MVFLKKEILKIGFLLLVVAIFAGTKKENIKKINPLPNIILIVADDLGYSDLASYGNQKINTPNIDSLGAEGIRFTRAYVTSPICSPSRMGIMTGRYQNRFGSEYMPYDTFDPELIRNLHRHYFALRRQIPGLKTLRPHLGLRESRYTTGLDHHELTMAEFLKKQEYSTGLIGKWNLGVDSGNKPLERGYDYSYYFDGALTRYVDDPVDTSRYINKHLPWSFSEIPAWSKRYGSTAIRDNGNIVSDTGYLTFSLAKKGIEFIQKNKSHPFFLTLTFNAPHDPFQAPKNYFDRIQNVQDTVKRVYYAMIEALDDAVGEIVKALKDAGVEDNTAVFFISDNGGATYTRATDNAPLRGGKCTHFEGGLMVPFFIKYPAVLKSPIVYDKPVSSLDIFSTIAAISQAQLPEDRVYDGKNLIPFLTGDNNPPHEIFYWRSGYSKAICKGEWKLYVNEKSKKTFLFNLKDDIGEKNDLAAKMPEKVKELKIEMETWEKTQTKSPSWPSAADVMIDVNGERFYFPS